MRPRNVVDNPLRKPLKQLLLFLTILTCITFGDIAFTDLEDKEIFAYTRTYGDKVLLCVCNFTDDSQVFALPENVLGKEGEVLLANYDDVTVGDSVALRPYECLVIQF